jgi:glutaredoxin
MSMLHYYTIYAKVDCGYCARAVTQLSHYGIDHLLVLLDQAPDFHSHLIKEYDWQTVPLIIKSDKITGNDTEFIGGYDDLMEVLDSEGYGEE